MNRYSNSDRITWVLPPNGYLRNEPNFIQQRGPTDFVSLATELSILSLRNLHCYRTACTSPVAVFSIPFKQKILPEVATFRLNHFTLHCRR